MKSVKELRRSGYKVKIIHHRVREKQTFSGKFDERMGDSAKGGRTELHLISPEGIQVSAEAKCSEKDNYCRRTGVAICLGRALKELEYQERLQKIKPKKEDSDFNFERPTFPTEDANKFPEADSVPLLEQIARDLCKKKIKELDNLVKDEQVSKNIERGLDFFKEVAEVFKSANKSIDYSDVERKIWENDKCV